MDIKLIKMLDRKIVRGINPRIEELYLGEYETEYGKLNFPVVHYIYCIFESDDNEDILNNNGDEYYVPSDFEIEIEKLCQVQDYEWNNVDVFADEYINILQ